MIEEEAEDPLEARTAEFGRLLTLVAEVPLEVIADLGRPGGPLQGDAHELLMTILYEIERVSAAQRVAAEERAR
ncbi:MAG: hypothetical protein R3B09_16015 [Nannocystaceae bacterium]